MQQRKSLSVVFGEAKPDVFTAASKVKLNEVWSLKCSINFCQTKSFYPPPRSQILKSSGYIKDTRIFVTVITDGYKLSFTFNFYGFCFGNLQPFHPSDSFGFSIIRKLSPLSPTIHFIVDIQLGETSFRFQNQARSLFQMLRPLRT